jgi:hypothetical protein
MAPGEKRSGIMVQPFDVRDENNGYCGFRAASSLFLFGQG